MRSGIKKSRSPSSLGERALIAAIRERVGPFSRRTLALGIGDDCAVLRPRPRQDLVVTTDLSLENVHFRRDWHPPQSVGHRCLARGLSDLAAMGATPVAAFLSLALPASVAGLKPGSWLSGFLEGFLALAARYQVPLAGGDTAKSPLDAAGGLVLADIVLVGSVPRGKALLRSGARAGDVLYVTGTLGGSAAELQAMQRRPAAFRAATEGVHPHLYPEPRLVIGAELLRRGIATAAIDLSDGLSTDLAHLCDESRLSAQLDLASLPIHLQANLDQALHGGEDYELLFTASPGTVVPKMIGGVAIHPIGRMRNPGKAAKVVLREGRRNTPLPPAGWEHLR